MPLSAEDKFRKRARRALEAGRPFSARGEANRAILEEVRKEVQTATSAGNEHLTQKQRARCRAMLKQRTARPPVTHPNKGYPGKDLYIMQCSAAPGILKIGRSNDCLNRAKVLQSQQWFYMKVLATFPGAGHHESQVHNFLHDRRLRNVPGQEWFTVTLQDAVSAIASCLCNDTKLPSESEHTPLFE